MWVLKGDFFFFPPPCYCFSWETWNNSGSHCSEKKEKRWSFIFVLSSSLRGSAQDVTAASQVFINGNTDMCRCSHCKLGLGINCKCACVCSSFCSVCILQIMHLLSVNVNLSSRCRCINCQWRMLVRSVIHFYCSSGALASGQPPRKQQTTASSFFLLV